MGGGSEGEGGGGRERGHGATPNGLVGIPPISPRVGPNWRQKSPCF